MKNKHLLSIKDLSSKEINAILLNAEQILSKKKKKKLLLIKI